MTITIPRREHVHRTDAADPVYWYYIWGTRTFFLRRLKMALAMLGSRKYGRLLDIGVGCGIFLPELSKHCDELHGIDIHDNIHLVEDMLRKEGVTATLSQASATEIPYPDEYFDSIVCLSVLEHIHDVEAVVSEIRRVIKTGGTIVLGFPVENLLSRVALQMAYIWMPNANLDDEHVSTHEDILKAAHAQLQVTRTQQFPAYVPLSLSLYCVCLCEKVENLNNS
jgi:2-polyprenyl-3-methyl-5-hydroxy-6-metoxy-1,4-benzoquinol methylase